MNRGKNYGGDVSYTSFWRTTSIVFSSVLPTRPPGKARIRAKIIKR